MRLLLLFAGIIFFLFIASIGETFAAECPYKKVIAGSFVCIDRPETLRRGELPENRRLELVPKTTRIFKPAKHIWKRVVDQRTKRQRKADAIETYHLMDDEIYPYSTIKK